MRTVILPQNPSPVALLFKDGGGLANHPLSCHPQGVFRNRENKRKTKKMKEEESSMKAYRPLLCISHPAKTSFFFYKGLSFYKALKRKMTKVKSAGENFAQWCENFAQGYEIAPAFLLFFCSSFAPPFLLISDLKC